ALDAIPEPLDALGVRAVRAAVVGAVALDPVTDDAAAAVRAARGERVDRALERIERVRRSPLQDLKCLVVVVATDFAARHNHLRGSGFAVPAAEAAAGGLSPRSF